MSSLTPVGPFPLQPVTVNETLSSEKKEPSFIKKRVHDRGFDEPAAKRKKLPNAFDVLPVELIIKIMKYLSPDDVKAFAFTSKRIKDCAFTAKIPQTAFIFQHLFFHKIAEKKYQDIINLINECGINPACDGNRAIMEVVSNGDLETLKHLIVDDRVDHLVEKKIEDQPSENLIALAAKNGHLDIIEFLLKTTHIDPNPNENLAIKLAAEKGHLTVLKFFFQNDKIIKHDYLDNILLIAAKNNHLEVVRYLLEEMRLNPNVLEDEGLTPIDYACANGNLEMLKILLADPRINLEESIPFTKAINHLEVVKFLLEDGRFSPNKEDGFANTPLEAAIENGNLEIIQLLLADPRICLDDYQLLMHKAVKGNYLTIVKLLINDGRVNPANNSNSSIRKAVKKENFEIIRVLLEDKRVSGIEMGWKDPPKNSSALMIAALNGRLEIVEMILKTHSLEKLDNKDPNNRALVFAAAKGDLEIVKLLAEICESAKGEAFKIAACNGHTEIVKFIFTKFELSTSDCTNALASAFYKNHKEIVKLILTDKKLTKEVIFLSGLIKIANAKKDAEIAKLLVETAFPGLTQLLLDNDQSS